MNRKYRIRYPELWITFASTQRYVRQERDDDELDCVFRMINDMYEGKGRYKEIGPRTLRQIAKACSTNKFSACHVSINKFVTDHRSRGGHNSVYGQRSKEDIELWKNVARDLGFSSVGSAIEALVMKYKKVYTTTEAVYMRTAQHFPLADSFSVSDSKRGHMAIATVRRGVEGKLKY